MSGEELRTAAAKAGRGELTSFLAEETGKLPKEEQKAVADRIDKDVWPQDSMHRMITILGCIVLALGAGALAILAYNSNAKEVGAALVALATAIVGGIFGYAQGSK